MSDHARKSLPLDLPALRAEAELRSAEHFVDGVLTPCTLRQLLDDADRWSIHSSTEAAMIGLLSNQVRQLLTALYEIEQHNEWFRKRCNRYETQLEELTDKLGEIEQERETLEVQIRILTTQRDESDGAHKLAEEHNERLREERETLKADVVRWKAVGEHYERQWKEDIQPKLKAAEAQLHSLKEKT